MNKTFKLISCICIIALLSSYATAQNLRNKPASDDLFTLANFYYDEDKDNLAEEIYLQIHPGDTNYVPALLKLGWLCYLSNRYDSAYQYINMALALPNKIETELMYLKGVTLYNMDKKDEAIAYMIECIEKYPYATGLHWGLSEIYYKSFDYANAEEHLVNCIRINPFNPLYHFRLAVINMGRSRVVPAMLALNMAVVMRSGSKQVANDLAVFGDICNGSYVDLLDDAGMLVFNEETDADFARIARMINSGMALRSSFKPKFKYKHVFVNNNEMLFDEIEKIDHKNDFYHDFYISFFLEMRRSKQLPPFFSYALESGNDPSYINWSQSRKGQKAYIRYIKWVSDYFTDKRIYMFNKELYGKGKNVLEFNSDGKVIGLGNFTDYTMRVSDGPAKIFYESGRLNMDVLFVDGLIDGKAVVYNEYGDTASVHEFVKGEMNGLSQHFHPNGLLYKEMYYKNADVHGEYREYNTSGNLLYKGQFENDLRTGKWIKYFPDGSIETEYYYEDGLLQGPYIDYFENGKVFLNCTYEKGSYSGEFANYYANGNISRTGIAKEGRKSGVWKRFYSNGNISSEEFFDDSLFMVRKIQYNLNGSKSSDYYYKNDKKHGVCSEFDGNGNMWFSVLYENDKPLKKILYDKNSNPIDSTFAKNGRLQLSIKYFNGNPAIEGVLGSKGKEGVFKYYTIYGIMYREENHKEGELSGKVTVYEINGNVRIQTFYRDDSTHGNRIDFYPDGVQKTDEYYRNGSRIGVKTEYFNNGKIDNRYYYLDGSYNGPDEFFNPDGIHYRTDLYEYGYRYRMEYTDSNGVAYTSGEFPYGNGSIELNDPTGRIMRKETQIGGKRHGLYQTFNSNGKMRFSGHYNLGKTDSVSTWYYSNGNVRRESRYSNDILHGETRHYDPDGRLIELKYYDFDDLHDTIKGYYYNGVLSYLMPTYDDDVHGEASFFNYQGELMYKVQFEGGYVTSCSYIDENGIMNENQTFTADSTVIKTFYPNGKLSAEISLKAGLFHGGLKHYSPNGRLIIERNYYLGRYHGENKTYYLDGKLRYAQSYHFGDQHGKLRFYSASGQPYLYSEYSCNNQHGETTIFNSRGKPQSVLIYNKGISIDYKEL